MRKTGGYADKIRQFRVKKWGATQDHGNGFLFIDYNSNGLEWALGQAINVHKRLQQDTQEHERQIRRLMVKARKHYTMEDMIAGYLTAYERTNSGNPLV